MDLQQLELDLWQSLATATQFPERANLRSLCDVLEQAIAEQPLPEQLQIVATALTQLSDLCAVRADLLLSDWEYRHDPQEPVVDLDSCVELFVQSLHLDLTDLMAEPDPDQYSRQNRNRCQAGDSVVGELDQGQLLAALDKQLNQHPEITEAEAFNQAVGVAHGEDIGDWVERILAYLHHYPGQAIPLMDLVQDVQFADEGEGQQSVTHLVKTWLTLLLGGFTLEQRGAFYSTNIWVSSPPETIGLG
ncbi:hypothetical protein BST81_24385 [Leptolyngbya sp. 'hensonii']|uniref:hypothetical protein n=1 Tax=Leptolyngbya sp. 'hensonii' TaxID=1922337 RepID=UPI00094FE984|nr:hypothetical protein [Leptolyngbya sp. 'hensonii']OLP15762.1 hypothetical protein BST81_24385 [Leptolyngbya sp. 'hensonii']